MKELHELLGVLTLTAGAAAILCGVVVYRHAWFRRYLGDRRASFLRWHLVSATGGALFLLLHYLTTDRVNGFLVAGALAGGAVYLSGLSFRLSKRHMKRVVTLKIALLAFMAIALPIGHFLAGAPEVGKSTQRDAAAATVCGHPGPALES